MEQYYQDNRNYGTTNCADAAGAAELGELRAGRPQVLHLRLRDCAAPGQGYTVTATGSAGQIGGANGHEYAIDDDNARTTTQVQGQTSEHRRVSAG